MGTNAKRERPKYHATAAVSGEKKPRAATKKGETAVSTSDSTVAIRLSDLLANDVMKFLENPLNALPPDPAIQANLISDDQPGHATALIQDPNLINPWGIAYSPTGPFWVSNNHTGTSTVYSVDPTTDA